VVRAGDVLLLLPLSMVILSAFAAARRGKGRQLPLYVLSEVPALNDLSAVEAQFLCTILPCTLF
jgi:hypothetical protein